ncbi:MAG: metallophosphoesterase [Actinomycetaceae bacterium]|nr:metallophosphoesterase [Actinomycetaceae bacterium]
MSPTNLTLKRAAATLGVLGAASWWAGARAAKRPRLEHYTLPVLDPGAADLKVLHLADMHFYPGQEWLVDWVRNLSDLDFDLVVSTGDNLNDASGIPLLKRALEPLFERPGFFVFGSHDYYETSAGNPLAYLWRLPEGQRDADPIEPGTLRHTQEAAATSSVGPALGNPADFEVPPSRHGARRLPSRQIRNFMAEGGWQDLTNQGARVELIDGRTVAAIGVDDPHIRRDAVPGVPEGWEDAGVVRLGLTHAPYSRVLDAFAGAGAQLVLAGHTHGGQVCLPWLGALVTNCDLPPAFVSGTFPWPQPLGAGRIVKVPEDLHGVVSGPATADTSNARFVRDEEAAGSNPSPAETAEQAAPLQPAPTYVHVSRGLGTARATPWRVFCPPHATLLRLTTRATHP